MMFRNAIRFLKDRRGTIAPVFALSLIPAVGTIGAAVDYTRANNIKAALQSSLDSTTLAMAGSAPNSSAEELTTKATSYFKAVFKKGGTTGVNLVVNYTNDTGPKLVMTGSTMVKNQFMNLTGIGISHIAVSASSTTAWSNARLRVALALDNTGSMAQSGKMGALKTAAKNLIDQLAAASKTQGDVYVSIVPFSKDVNVGASNVNASWVRFSGPNPENDNWDDLNGSCSMGNSNNKSACVSRGTCSVSGNNSQNSCNSAGICSIGGYSSQNGCTSHGICSRSGNNSQSSCSSNGGTWTWGQWTPATWTAAVWTPASRTTWNGCVMDRDQSRDIDNAAPSAGDSSTLFPAEQFTDCPVEMMPLSYNWGNLKTKIDSMNPTGNTNTTIGLEWAWHSLTAGAPLYAPAEDPLYDYKKVIIFLTDGDNTENRVWSTDRNSPKYRSDAQSKIDGRMKDACANAKNPASVNGNVEIYTILVMQGSAPLLQNCASNPSDHYFKITAANQLVSVFKELGAKLAKLHVAK